MALCQKFGRLLIGAEARFSARTDVTNTSTSLNQSPAPTQIPARLPYNVPNAFTLFTKDQMTGQSGRVHEMGKILSTNWKNLSEEEKQNYSERAKAICDELRENFEKLTNGQKKDLWDKHAEKRNKLQRYRMKKKLRKFYAETNRPKQPLTSYMIFVKERFEKQTEPLKTKDKVRKFGVEMGQQWRQMTDAEKRPYVDQEQSNFAKFRVEMAEWTQKYANEIRAWKEAEAKAARKAKDTQFTEALFEWNIDDDLNEQEAFHQMLLDDSTHLVEERKRRSDDDDRDVDEEEAAIQRSVTNTSTSLDQLPAPAQNPARLPYNTLKSFALFTKDQMTGQCGGPELVKILSANWKNLSESEKQNYSERAKAICDELRDNFEKLTNGQKKDLWDKHVEKRNKLQRYRMKKKRQKFYAETNRPERPLVSYSVFTKERFENHTKPIKTRDERKKIFAETGQRWRQMTAAEKQPYVDQAQGNIPAYHMEMAEWKRKYANEIRAWKEAEAKAAQKAKDTQFTEALFEWNTDGDRDLNEQEAIQQMLLDDSTPLVEKRERSSDDDNGDVDEEAASQRSVTNISTSLDQSPAPKQIPVRLPSSYKALRPLSLFMKEHLTGGSGDPKLLKIVSTNWKSLSEEEKQNYSERAKKICDELRDNFEKLTNRQKKDLWDKHAEKMNNRMKRKLNKFYAETNRPKLPSRSYMVFVKECFEKQTKPIKTKVEQNKFVAEMAQQWRQMTDAEKRPYVDQAQCNFSAYHMEMAEWKRKYANEIRAWKEAEAKAAQKARDTQFYQAPSEWNLDDDRDVLVDEREHIQQMLLDDSTHLVEERELSSDDDRDEDEEAIQRMFLAISTYLGRKEISQNQRIEY